MTSPGWLTRSFADVPADDGWLAPGETEVLAGLRVEKRRADWRLGRFAAKAGVAVWLGVRPTQVEGRAGARGPCRRCPPRPRGQPAVDRQGSGRQGAPRGAAPRRARRRGRARRA